MATQHLLSGVAETTFNNLVAADEMEVPVTALFDYLEECATNLSNLMLQQTLLEQEVFRQTSSCSDDEASMDRVISQSKELMQRCSSTLPAARYRAKIVADISRIRTRSRTS